MYIVVCDRQAVFDIFTRGSGMEMDLLRATMDCWFVCFGCICIRFGRGMGVWTPLDVDVAYFDLEEAESNAD